ncbi:MAG: omega-6 fatty acid desaturase (delta-12 desaturase) [Planctomycetota bacterium]|jgi:omega-6 fatty acid desaturase (delta-12 desaturase)
MRNSKDIIRESLTYAREQRGRSWWHLISTLSLVLALGATICVFSSWLILLPASIVLGLTLVRMFIIYHDFQHGTILKRSKVAKALLSVYGILVLNPPSIWSRSHEHHHRNVGKIYGSSIGSYPVMTIAAWERAGRWQRIGYIFQRHPLTIALGYVTIFLYGMCIRSFLVNRRQHADSAIAVVVHLTIVVLMAVFAPWLLLFLVLVPMTVACGLGAYLFYAQHNFPQVKMMESKDWSYLTAALESSSYMRMGAVMRWFTGNIGYHHVHHVNAKIPFYRLPEAMAGIPELEPRSSTSLSPRQIWKCLRLRFWDDSRGCMTV